MFECFSYVCVTTCGARRTLNAARTLLSFLLFHALPPAHLLGLPSNKLHTYFLNSPHRPLDRHRQRLAINNDAEVLVVQGAFTHV
ncbi:hypothetical protein IWZ00DRAFT_500664 [Phyllosticta capitalensis]